LSKLTAKPVYYIWFDPKVDVEISMLDVRRQSRKENR